MVKVERVTLQTPNLAVPPPGFSLKTPTAKRTTADGGSQPLSPPPSEEGSREQAVADMSARRTSRRRVEPQFYSPPTPTELCRRRRSRPSKARSLAQLSCQEKVTENDDHHSKTLAKWLEQITCASPSQSIHFTGERSKSRSRKNNHLSKETNGNITAPSKAPKIIRNSGGSMVDKNQTSDANIKTSLALTLNAINEKHGDIAKECILESDRMKTVLLFGICEVVQELERKPLKDLDVSTLASCYLAIEDAEKMKINVKWLLNGLDEIKCVVESTSEALKLMDEKKRLTESIESKKKHILLRKGEVKMINLEIEEMEGEVTRDVVKIEALEEDIRTQTSKFQLLEETPRLI